MADKSSSLRFDDGSLKPLERSLEGKGREFDPRPELDFFDGFVPKFGYAAHHVARLGAKGPGLKPSEEFSDDGVVHRVGDDGVGGAPVKEQCQAARQPLVAGDPSLLLHPVRGGRRRRLASGIRFLGRRDVAVLEGRKVSLLDSRQDVREGFILVVIMVHGVLSFLSLAYRVSNSVKRCHSGTIS